jgi:AraC-like DNA-binding protein
MLKRGGGLILYQKLLMGNEPYFISVNKAHGFEAHRHSEAEISYCIDGSYDIICENKRYTLSVGDVAVVAPMATHEFPKGHEASQRMTLELGYSLIGSYFEGFSTIDGGCIVFRHGDPAANENYDKLKNILDETAKILLTPSDFGKLTVKGNLYCAAATLLDMIQRSFDAPRGSKSASDIQKVDRALEMIYSRYFEPLTVEEIGGICGYSKSNFCKIFKRITGDTFHNTLVRHRIKMACTLLTQTDLSVERIAAETGFADSKSFCRVFKRILGYTAGEYRKSKKTEV